MNNMELWDKVSETDPGETKAVSYGARKFTAIDAYAQIKRATGLWGPYGTDWGLFRLETWVDGEYLFLKAIFRHPNDGEFPVANNIKVGDDCVKKITTDTLTKALSMLGFNADVFLGKFDDNKYVADMKAKYKKDNPSEKPKKKASKVNVALMTADQKTQLNDILIDADLETSAANKKKLAKTYGITGKTTAKEAEEIIHKIIEDFASGKRL